MLKFVIITNIPKRLQRSELRIKVCFFSNIRAAGQTLKFVYRGEVKLISWIVNGVKFASAGISVYLTHFFG